MPAHTFVAGKVTSAAQKTNQLSLYQECITFHAVCQPKIISWIIIYNFCHILLQKKNKNKKKNFTIVTLNRKNTNNKQKEMNLQSFKYAVFTLEIWEMRREGEELWRSSTGFWHMVKLNWSRRKCFYCSAKKKSSSW